MAPANVQLLTEYRTMRYMLIAAAALLLAGCGGVPFVPCI